MNSAANARGSAFSSEARASLLLPTRIALPLVDLLESFAQQRRKGPGHGHGRLEAVENALDVLVPADPLRDLKRVESEGRDSLVAGGVHGQGAREAPSRRVRVLLEALEQTILALPRLEDQQRNAAAGELDQQTQDAFAEVIEDDLEAIGASLVAGDDRRAGRRALDHRAYEAPAHLGQGIEGADGELLHVLRRVERGRCETQGDSTGPQTGSLASAGRAVSASSVGWRGQVSTGCSSR